MNIPSGYFTRSQGCSPGIIAARSMAIDTAITNKTKMFWQSGWLRLFLLAVCVLLFTDSCLAGQNQPNILILNSYHQGEKWSDNELAGMLSALRQSYPNLVPQVELLDTKRFPGSAHLAVLKGYLLQKYRGRKVDLIIALDNPALDLLVQNANDLFPEVPVVFAGINGYRPELIAGRKKVTGVIQLLDVAGTLKMALSLHPEASEVLVIHDYTVSGLAVRQETEATLAQFSDKLKIHYAPDGPFDDLSQELCAMPNNGIVLLLTYVTDKEGHTFTRDESTRLIASLSPSPVYAVHETSLGFGIIGGMLLEGQEHGRQAAGLAHRVLQGADPDQIPMEESRSRCIIDYKVISRLQIAERLWPAGALIVNRPVSFWDRHRNVLIPSIAAIIALVAFSMLLFVTVIRLRRSKTAIRKSAEKYRVLFSSIPLGITVTNRSGSIAETNDMAAKLLGVPKEEHEVRTIDGPEWHIIRPDGLPMPPEEYAGVRALQENTLVENVEMGIVRPTAETLWLSVTAAPIHLEEYGVMVIYSDITERRRSEEERNKLEVQLAQARKMESVGRLAGGVAHDFNNMLGVILGYCELSLKQIDAAHPLFNGLENIHKAAERSADLTQQLLAFARKQTVAPKVLDLNQVVEGMLNMLLRLISEDVDLTWLPGENLGAVKMDPSQVDQLLVNLCVNARDSIGDTGKITIKTSAAVFDEPWCATHAELVPGEYVLLAVSDNGRGMDSETLSHLFEPFFTTKELGKGTGLGLATVYGIVKQNNGFIDVYSELGRGTTFKIYLPRHEIKAEQPARTDVAKPIARGHETILLVEDEPMILEMTREMLEGQGYVVLPAPTPGEAIRLAREHTGTIHLLMTDVVMPEMNGRDLAANLLFLNSNLKLLFMSGYTANVIAHHGVLDEGVHFIQKPFTLKELSSKVRETLDAGTRAGNT
ncbi:MAG: response regulator [Desulfobulbaceae bacterium]|nr:response regulator [Desulfobulbaceae bacterium]